jgi:hypothetical protein
MALFKQESHSDLLRVLDVNTCSINLCSSYEIAGHPLYVRYPALNGPTANFEHDHGQQ